MLRFVKSFFEWIFTPFSKSAQNINSEKICKFFTHNPVMIIITSLIFTAAFMFIMYFYN